MSTPSNIQRRFAASVPRDRDATPRADLTDTERLEFCLALTQSEKVEVTAWEASFLNSNWTTVEMLVAIKARPQPNTFFSNPQRVAIDRMINKYAQRIGW